MFMKLFLPFLAYKLVQASLALDLMVLWGACFMLEILRSLLMASVCYVSTNTYTKT